MRRGRGGGAYGGAATRVLGGGGAPCLSFLAGGRRRFTLFFYAWRWPACGCHWTCRPCQWARDGRGRGPLQAVSKKGCAGRHRPTAAGGPGSGKGSTAGGSLHRPGGCPRWPRLAPEGGGVVTTRGGRPGEVSPSSTPLSRSTASLYPPAISLLPLCPTQPTGAAPRDSPRPTPSFGRRWCRLE